MGKGMVSAGGGVGKWVGVWGPNNASLFNRRPATYCKFPLNQPCMKAA